MKDTERRWGRKGGGHRQQVRDSAEAKRELLLLGVDVSFVRGHRFRTKTEAPRELLSQTEAAQTLSSEHLWRKPLCLKLGDWVPRE